jgi:hypothetical protein
MTTLPVANAGHHTRKSETPKVSATRRGTVWQSFRARILALVLVQGLLSVRVNAKGQDLDHQAITIAVETALVNEGGVPEKLLPNPEQLRCAAVGARSFCGTSTRPPDGGGIPANLMRRGQISPSGGRGVPGRVQFYADGSRPLTGRPGKPAIAVIQIFPWVIESEICGDHEDVGIAR